MSLCCQIASAAISLCPRELKRRLENYVFLDKPTYLPEDTLHHTDTYALVLGGAKNRVERAVELYRRGIVNKIIASGGIGPFSTNRNIPEAVEFHNQLVALGIPESDIIVESRSTNTMENIAFSLDKITLYDEGITMHYNLVMVTSNYHMKRALLILEKYLKICPDSVSIYWAGSTSPRCERSTWDSSPYGRFTLLKEVLRLTQLKFTR